MDVIIELKNTNMSEADVINLSSHDLDGTDVAVVHQPNTQLQKEKIAERLEALVQDQGRKSSFKTALRPWVQDVTDKSFPLMAGTYTLKLSIICNTNKPEFAGHIGLNLYAVPLKAAPAVMVEHGMIHPSAVTELGAITPSMKQALKMVFNKTATGRSAPGTTNVNHIHVGGNAQENLLFLTQAGALPYVVLGLVDGHIDKSAPPSVKAAAQRITGRSSTAATARDYRIVGTALVNP